MTIHYRISEQDYMGARDLFVANEKPLYRKVSRRLMPWLGAFVLGMEVFYLVVVPHRDPVLVGFGGLIGLFTVVFWLRVVPSFS